MQKICPVCSNSRQKETRTAEDKLPILFREAFWGCRKWSEPRCNCLISCRSMCLEKNCSRLLRSRMNKNEMNEWNETVYAETAHLQACWHLTVKLRRKRKKRKRAKKSTTQQGSKQFYCYPMQWGMRQKTSIVVPLPWKGYDRSKSRIICLTKHQGHLLTNYQFLMKRTQQ